MHLFPRAAVPQHDSDDKHAKSKSKKDILSFALAMDGLRPNTVSILCAKILMATGVLYAIFLVAPQLGSYTEWIGYASTVAEVGGLVILRFKIKSRGGVMGVSRTTVIILAMIFPNRMWEFFPRSRREMSADNCVAEIASLAAFLLVCEILVCVFRTHRDSYQEDLDVVKVKHVVPACAVLSLVLHPFFQQGFFHSYLWTFGFYLEVVALLPQVVMMAKGDGKVEAPISHFVAATALSRSIDLWWWYTRGLELGPQGYVYGFNYSGWLIVVVHVLALLLAADFMYYYAKARLAGASLEEDLVLPMENLC